MQLRYQVLTTTKAGNQPAEMEDAASPTVEAAIDAASFRCAIADGATQGSHSGPWATVLCAEFVATGAPDADALAALVPTAQARFVAWEKDYLANRAAQNRPLAWFEAEVMGTGAYSTLVGLQLDQDQTDQAVRWRALAVGDSCLFHVRAGRQLVSFPLTQSAEFSNAPFLIASQTAANRQLAGAARWLDGDLAVGDRLVLGTDALSAWIMRQCGSGPLTVGARPRAARWPRRLSGVLDRAAPRQADAQR